jgi:hypothetical protein
VISLLAVRYGASEKPPLAAGQLDRLDGRVRLLDVFIAPATGKATALLGTPRRTDWRLQPRAGQALIRHHSRHLQSLRFASCWEAAPLIHAGHDACFLSLRSEHSERLEG